MKKGIGIQLNDSNDLSISVKHRFNKIASGMLIGPTGGQNQLVLLQAHPGELKHAPVTGVGIADMLLDDNPLYWRSRIRQALEREGFTINRLELSGTNLDLDASY